MSGLIRLPVSSARYAWAGTAPSGRARAVRELTAEEREYLVYVAGNYVNLKDRYLAEAAGT